MSDVGANLPAQRIGPNDLIAISVYDSPELTRTARVGADGMFRLPMLKQRIKAEGLMPADLEEKIADALKEEDIIVDPFVTVTIAEYHSRPISVMGAVKTPVTFQAESPVTLLDALARAGGLTFEAGPDVLVTRMPRPEPDAAAEANGAAQANGAAEANGDPGANDAAPAARGDNDAAIAPPAANDAAPAAPHTNKAALAALGLNDPPAALVQRISIKSLIDGADPGANLKLTGGEEVRVPEAGKVFVVGNVHKPGAFMVRDNSEMTILKAVALSEGLMPFAGKQAFIYRLEGGAAQKNEIPVELSKIMDRKAPDVPLAANDVLYIPDNKGRRMTVGTLEKLLVVGGGAAAAAVYTLR